MTCLLLVAAVAIVMVFAADDRCARTSAFRSDILSEVL